MYYNIHVTEDRDAGLNTTATYLREYYGVDYDRDFLERWVAIGDPARCANELRIVHRRGRHDYYATLDRP